MNIQHYIESSSILVWFGITLQPDIGHAFRVLGFEKVGTILYACDLDLFKELFQIVVLHAYVASSGWNCIIIERESWIPLKLVLEGVSVVAFTIMNFHEQYAAQSKLSVLFYN